MCAGHDDSELNLDAELEEPNESSGNLLIGLGVNWVEIGRRVKEVHGVWGRLNREGIGTAGGEDLRDSMVRRTSHGSGVFVVGEDHTEVTIHFCLV